MHSTEKSFIKLRLSFFTLVLAQALIADTIISVHGDPISSAGKILFAGESLAASWTSTASYLDVGITVKLLVNPNFPPRNVTAYLTDKIGPGTTAADEVAPSFTFTALAGPFPFQPTIEVFQNLTLGLGTYYLTLSSDAPDFNTPVAWSVASHSTTIETGPGVTRNTDLTTFGNTQDPFAPASVFSALAFDSSDPLEFAVTGKPVVSSVPEPSSLPLCALGIVLAIGVRSLRRNAAR